LDGSRLHLQNGKKPFYGFYGSFIGNDFNFFGDWPRCFDRAFHKITATDCDTVRPAVAPKAFRAMARQARPAERWQKDEGAEK
jgi:hypothetical protein